MHCDECKYRFKCFTLAKNERPKRVYVRWDTSRTCGTCRRATFLRRVKNYGLVERPVGFCDRGFMIHKNSEACDKYESRRAARTSKVHKELNELILERNNKTKLPKYCIIDDE